MGKGGWGWILSFECLPVVLWLLVFCGSSSRDRWLVCSVIVVFPDHILFIFCNKSMLSVSYCMVCACVREDNHPDSFGNSVYSASTLFHIHDESM